MSVYLTEYSQYGHTWFGCEIEAASFEEATAIANQIASLEQQLQKPRFNMLVVLGTLEAEIPFELGHAHAVTQMRCDLCLHDWTAVYPAATEFLNCPHCNYVNPAR